MSLEHDPPLPTHRPQVLHHPLTLSYLGLSGLTGLALTYYYNNTENRKVKSSLDIVLSCAGHGELDRVCPHHREPQGETSCCCCLESASAERGELELSLPTTPRTAR